MNAYELAKLLDFDAETLNWKAFADAANMLRQQADRIAELENQLDKCSHYEAMAHQGGYEIGRASQIKELSDEEINKTYLELANSKWGWQIDFARAILRKAQEK